MEGYEVITSDEHKAGQEPAPERRARILEGDAPLDRPAGRQIIPSDPHEER